MTRINNQKNNTFFKKNQLNFYIQIKRERFVEQNNSKYIKIKF